MDMIQDYLAHLKAAQKSAETLRTRKYYLLRISRDFDLLKINSKELEKWFSAHEWARETARSARSTFANFFLWAKEYGYRADNPAAKLPRIKEAPPCAKPLPEMYYQNALHEAEPLAHLAIRLAGEAGLRRSEVAKLKIADLEPDLLGFSLRVNGKGGKIRVIPISDSLAKEIRIFAGAGPWVFPSPVSGGPLTADCIAKKVAAHLPKGYSMHSLRHRFATTIYTATNDIRSVQELLGHSTLNTTQRYVATDKARLRAVAMTAA